MEGKLWGLKAKAVPSSAATQITTGAHGRQNTCLPKLRTWVQIPRIHINPDICNSNAPILLWESGTGDYLEAGGPAAWHTKATSYITLVFNTVEWEDWHLRLSSDLNILATAHAHLHLHPRMQIHMHTESPVGKEREVGEVKKHKTHPWIEVTKLPTRPSNSDSVSFKTVTSCKILHGSLSKPHLLYLGCQRLKDLLELPLSFALERSQTLPNVSLRCHRILV